MSRSVPSRLRPLVLTRRVQFLLDLGALVTAFYLAYLLRFEFQIPDSWHTRVILQLPLVVMIQFSALLLTGIYTFVWRYVGLRELTAFVKASLFSMLPLLALRLVGFMLPENLQNWTIPLSVIFVDGVLAFGGLLGLRVVRRMLYERSERLRRAGHGDSHGGTDQRALLVGAGRAGVLAMREIQNRGDMGLEIVGFVDDDPLKQTMVIQGTRVLGTTKDLPSLVREHRVKQVVITIADAPREELQRIVGLCERAGVRVRSIPGLFELLQGKVEISRFRDVEIEDLLDRPPVDLAAGRPGQVFSDHRVLITGAGGSIGSELARQVARLHPARLSLVERAENALFEIHRELTGLWPDLPIEPLLADVGDTSRMQAIFGASRPDVVLHSAAHKHVPMVELNPAEAIKNNVLATRKLGELAGRSGCDRFVLVSTDKAVHPTSVMGASKRLAELVMQELDGRFATPFVAVRFGNVMGSAGSVIPIFREQIARGGPVTVTHPEMKRYFMTIPEAASLVLEAGAMGEGGELFVLDMGEPMRIVDLARKMIRLSALVPDEDIEIVFTGIRPGEKLFEELEVSGEDIAKTRHPKIFIGRLSGPSGNNLQAALARLEAVMRTGADGEIRLLLSELLPEAKLDGAPPATNKKTPGPGPGVPISTG
jgi:FlaA1/EpsC-like NDP-sugar epimerase